MHKKKPAFLVLLTIAFPIDGNYNKSASAWKGVSNEDLIYREQPYFS